MSTIQDIFSMTYTMGADLQRARDQNQKLTEENQTLTRKLREAELVISNAARASAPPEPDDTPSV